MGFKFQIEKLVGSDPTFERQQVELGRPIKSDALAFWRRDAGNRCATQYPSFGWALRNNSSVSMSRQFTGTRPACSRSQARRKIASIRWRLASRAWSRSGMASRRKQAAERRQAEHLLAARERGEHDEQTLPAVVVAVPGGAPHRAVAQRGDRIALGVELARRRRDVGRMQQVAVLGGEQEDQSIDEAQQLTEELRQRQRAGAAASRAARRCRDARESRCRG